MYRPCGYARNRRPSVSRELTPVLKQVNSEVVTKKTLAFLAYPLFGNNKSQVLLLSLDPSYN